jgi:hypothetical protein
VDCIELQTNKGQIYAEYIHKNVYCFLAKDTNKWQTLTTESKSKKEMYFYGFQCILVILKTDDITA